MVTANDYPDTIQSIDLQQPLKDVVDLTFGCISKKVWNPNEQYAYEYSRWLGPAFDQTFEGAHISLAGIAYLLTGCEKRVEPEYAEAQAIFRCVYVQDRLIDDRQQWHGCPTPLATLGREASYGTWRKATSSELGVRAFRGDEWRRVMWDGSVSRWQAVQALRHPPEEENAMYSPRMRRWAGQVMHRPAPLDAVMSRQYYMDEAKQRFMWFPTIWWRRILLGAGMLDADEVMNTIAPLCVLAGQLRNDANGEKEDIADLTKTAVLCLAWETNSTLRRELESIIVNDMGSGEAKQRMLEICQESKATAAVRRWAGSLATRAMGIVAESSLPVLQRTALSGFLRRQYLIGTTETSDVVDTQAATKFLESAARIAPMLCR